ncbi:Nif11-like leader peptide family RiPP precursor [uncultured Thiohalocapsa sp.]|uniref:Nif11-like leader peptide family RiPP precursor n=1 Tax=uncultured Thiohalocapsa sp. TaxID=768990 RepID=UPI0025DA0FDB|nr:Nif11-like leader peptide family RiPP precursor [uncultured Thiohalocapsa sp.]
MSQEDLTQFLEAVQQDPSLQEKLKAEGADPVAIAMEAGFSITQAELIRQQAGRIQSLSDEELENAAGGVWSANCTDDVVCGGL